MHVAVLKILVKHARRINIIRVCLDVCASLDAHEAAYSQAPPSTLLAFLGQSLLKLQGNPYFRNFHPSCAILKTESAWACSIGIG